MSRATGKPFVTRFRRHEHARHTGARRSDARLIHTPFVPRHVCLVGEVKTRPLRCYPLMHFTKEVHLQNQMRASHITQILKEYLAGLVKIF